jgi:hypothetical protein
LRVWIAESEGGKRAGKKAFRTDTKTIKIQKCEAIDDSGTLNMGHPF